MQFACVSQCTPRELLEPIALEQINRSLLLLLIIAAGSDRGSAGSAGAAGTEPQTNLQSAGVQLP